MSLGPGDPGWESHTLFEEYSPSGKLSTMSRRVGHSPTKGSRLRTGIVKLSCYLNGEADRTRAAVVKLPEECDTLGEVIPKIHKRLDLDKRIAYAAELFLPDGKKITSYKMLVDAAENDHAIIVSCGEAFDPTTVPYDLLEAYLHGGGRDALKKVSKELKSKQKMACHEKADTVRQSGHGVYPNSAAVVTSRSQTVLSNKELAAQMRHEYMEQLMYRAEQQKLLTSTVQANTQMRKAENAASKQRRMEMDAERMADIAEENEKERQRFQEKRAALQAKIKSRHDNIHKQYKNRHQGQYDRIKGDFVADSAFTHAPGETETAMLGGQRGRDGAGATVSGTTNFSSHVL